MSETVGVVGSGTIACGFAAVAATKGEVVLRARSEESVERASKLVAKNLNGSGAAADRITFATDLTDLSGCSFIVEAIAEDVASKSPLLAELDEIAGEDTILATTTSSLSVEVLAGASNRPERFAGFHVFNPVTKMALVELIFPKAASDATRQRSLALCEALGKTPVEVPDTPGFVVNKLLFPYLFSAVDLQDETGLSSEAIDTCMKLGCAHPLGPLALLDLVGLDVSVAIADEIGVEVPERIRKMVDEGTLGRKTKKGLYTYD